ncbi:acyltransferase family protein [Bacillus sp. EB01]|uniref:acyltransferase family protein n=1 Tax=Bacillus sp. EB01 TaxID=1347086 RepID=UPI0005C79CA6|nr:acyltransferase [Bacillus sp. EB01]
MQERKHIYYIDNLKIAICMLVVAHHAGQAYGPGGWWYFQEGESVQWLGRFFAVNASFFMSMFFFLSAYFLPRSLESKGPKKFLIERFKRIGIPLIPGFLLMIPILMYFYYINFREYGTPSFFSYYGRIFFGMAEQPRGWTGPSWPDMQFGHLWFLEHLLVYAVILAVWTYFFPLKESHSSKLKTYQIIGFIAALSAATFLIRIEFPIDRWAGALGIIQTEYAHLPQYASFFVLGLLASRKKWLETMNAHTGYAWLGVGLVFVAFFYLSNEGIISFFTKGGFNTGNLAKSIVETVLCTSLIIGLIILFREHLNGTGKLSKLLASNVFVVYFIHVPVVVFLQYMVTDLPVSTLSKFILTASFGILLSFLFSIYVWRKIPYLKTLM